MGWFTKKNKPFVVSLPETHESGQLDPHSATWMFVVEKANAEIERTRIKNDNPGLSETQTAVIRGKIKALKTVLAWPDDKKGILNR